MKTPVWTIELIRLTDAPLGLVEAALMDPTRPWHPRPGTAPLEQVAREEDFLELSQTERPCWGVTERALYRLEARDEGLLLSYRARFRGWPALILMGYWRIKSRRLWESLVESLPAPES
nr:hypothetical protein [uncultured Holophaga sp.]